jgi:hypothetical protein
VNTRIPYRIFILLAVASMFAGIMTCARAPRPIDPNALGAGDDYWAAATETAAVIHTQEAQFTVVEQATQAVQMTASAGPTLTETIRPMALVSDDFSQDIGLFTYTVGAAFGDGTLLLGPAESCSLDRPDYVQPVGCLALCQACSSLSGNYSMRIDSRYAEGVSEREFGVILRFVDEDRDGLLGDGDYLLAMGINIFTNEVKIYVHEPGSGLPMQLVEAKEGGFYSSTLFNTFEIISSDGGREMDVLMNESRIFRLRGYSSEPGETFVEPWVDSGAVGLMLLQRGVQAQYDNFSFQPLE